MVDVILIDDGLTPFRRINSDCTKGFEELPSLLPDGRIFGQVRHQNVIGGCRILISQNLYGQISLTAESSSGVRKHGTVSGILFGQLGRQLIRVL